MSYNDFFSSNNLDKLVHELSSKYSINNNEVMECINKALSKSYNYDRVVFNKDGSITGMKKVKNTNVIKHHNISKKIYKNFQNNIHNEFYQSSFKKIEKQLSKLIIKSNNIFFGKIVETNNESFKLALYDRNSTQLKNFYAIIQKKSNSIFKNELYNKKYEELDTGLLIYIPKREKIKIEEGRFFIKAIRKHETLVRYKINNIFKELNRVLENTYSYKKCFINLKKKTITFFTNIRFSEVAMNFINKELLKIDDFKITYIKD